MTTRKGLHIHSCPLLPKADGHFADHIKYDRVIRSEWIAFDLVTGVLGKLGSALWNEIGLLRSFKDDANDLERKLLKIQAVLLDAEERSRVEKESDSLLIWLRELKGAAYDIDDLLDEIQTQALLRKQQRELQNQNQLAKMVCDQFLSCANPINVNFKFKMARRMKELREKIDKIAKQRHDFGLVEAGPRRQAEFKRPETTISVVDEKEIVGRDDDKEKIVQLLLETNGDHDVSVISIFGMGGLGKTTLAQLAFNDWRVKGEQGFDLRVWVCASTDFDMKTIAKPVIDEAGEKYDDLDNPDAVARCLLRIFSQKKFLLVLDDVWNSDRGNWEKLKVLFKDGTKGSKILVTTRNLEVTKIMKTVKLHDLKGLSYDDSWKLFKSRAFEEGEENNYPNLVKIGKQIMEKCRGLPLAVNALGGMMRFKSRTEDAWSAIRNSEIWRLEEEKTILPSLILSYIQMPSALKQCFAYCSIFRNDYEIDKDDLIRQWIALGFISSLDTSTSMEDIGNEYFNDLLWMSFLQDVKKHWKSEKVTCRMHDLVHYLAQSVAREEVAVIVGEDSTSIPEGCRYASIHSRSIQQVPTTVKQRLRALQFGESASLITFCSEAKSLRMLDFHDSEISVLPSSIGKLKLLRYLNLSSTNIQELPESITGLCNLQTLNLSFCQEIRTLPKFLGRLANLRILNLSSCYSLTLLDSISNLQNLYTLNLSSCEKVISLEPICHLKNLHYLDLSHLDSLVTLPESIGNLQNLHILNLFECTSLRSLPVSIGSLQNLRILNLFECTSLLSLPVSIGSLQNLHHLNLSLCKNVRSLEPICHLKNLHHLDLSHLDSLVTLPESIGSLQNLHILNLFECTSLRSLPISIGSLQNLRILNLFECTSLLSLPESIGSLQNLRILNLLECSSLRSFPSSSSELRQLEKLDISHCKQLCELPKMIEKLTKLRELLNKDCLELKAMPRGIDKLVSLRELPIFVIGKQDHVEHCASISELEHLKLVGELEIKGLKNVTNPVDAKAANLIEKKLRSLKLKWNVLSPAENMDTVQPAEEMDAAVLENLQPHQNLANLVIEGYAGRKFPSWMMNKISWRLPNLVEIKLVNMPRCSSLPPLGQLPSLKTLKIQNMPAITNLGVEFYGASHINASLKMFPELTTLELLDMPVLGEWVMMVLTVDKGRRKRVPIFPCLTHLRLDNCPQLRPKPCLPASVEYLAIFRTSNENLSLILEHATMDSEIPLDDGDGAISLQPPNKGLRELDITNCQQVICLPKSLQSLTSLQKLRISGCEDLKRIEDWLGELTDLQSLTIYNCNSLQYLPAHKMTTLKELSIEDCPLLFNEDGQFADTSVDHINEVYVNSRNYKDKKQMSSSRQEEEIAPEGGGRGELTKKSWTRCWR